MPRLCEICGKKTVFGNSISHAHNVTSRPWLPNLQRVRVAIEGGGSRRIRVCTRCLRSGLFRKAVSGGAGQTRARATASISTRPPRGSAETSTQTRAGGASAKKVE